MYYLQFAKINTPGRLIERGRKKCGYGRRIGECVTEGIGPLSVFSPKEDHGSQMSVLFMEGDLVVALEKIKGPE